MNADLRWFDIMKNTPAESKYVTLVADIGRLYEGAQRALVDAYWRIGRRIVEEEQGGSVRAQYGDQLLERLSVDLSDRYGTGFSVDNLERMRRFYLTHPNSAAPRKLAWTQYVELLSVDDDEARVELERRAETEGLTSRELRTLASQYDSLPRVSDGIAATPAHAAAPLRRPTDLRFRTCRLASAPSSIVTAGHILVDCGFGVFRDIPELPDGYLLTDKPRYTYPTIVERVVDGDTVWGFIDAGFGTVVRLKLRLHGISAAEVGTEQGMASRDYVARLLPPGSAMVIRSYASDAFGRFLADIFCQEVPVSSPPAAEFEKILSNGIFLNQVLVDKGLAERVAIR